MDGFHLLLTGLALAPAALMCASMLLPLRARAQPAQLWSAYLALAVAALLCTVAALGVRALSGAAPSPLTVPGLATSTAGGWMAVLVQLLATVIGAFSARYLQGEAAQPRCVAAFGAVLAAVHLLLLADHWLVLIAAWAAVGTALQRLLCFYPDRAFALLAAHKKRLADRLSDVLLLAAAACAWAEVGSGSLAELWRHAAQAGATPLLQACAVCFVLAVILRTALLPVHGWLIQVMEAPTPVSALLHAGVVNLGGFLLIRFAPLLEASTAARWLLVAFGLGTAVLAGLVMLTRVTIKVRLAWSTVAQMGFMVLECGLGLYSLAAVHLIGHSLYKAHAFLAASSVVRQTRLQDLRGGAPAGLASLLAAPALCAAIVVPLAAAWPQAGWPWWWSALLALAWAPMLWAPAWRPATRTADLARLLAGAGAVAGLTAAALLLHALPLGVADVPHHAAGIAALLGMAAMYACLAVMQRQPQRLATWRRWSYAGFYVDEYATRVALRLWPAPWAPTTRTAAGEPSRPLPASAAP